MITRSKLVLSFVLLVGGVAFAQTVTPPNAEYRGLKAEGAFRIDNNTDQPMLVALETKSFKVDDNGKAVFSPLQARVHLDLGSSSFVISPHDNHTVYYKAVSTISAVSFAVVPTMTPMTQTKGIRVNFCIPHLIYLYQKAKLTKGDVQVAMNDGNVTIVNNSERLGRVEFIHAGSNDLNGFPIYPGQTRKVAVSGDKATVQFEEGFKVDFVEGSQYESPAIAAFGAHEPDRTVPGYFRRRFSDFGHGGGADQLSVQGAVWLDWDRLL